MIAHCFFEQSGTFKQAFIKNGIIAYDYDIKNEFNETDFVIDLFSEIESAFNDRKSVFDQISKDDLIFAFFPCVRFSQQFIFHLNGSFSSFKNYTLRQKLIKNIIQHDELNYFYKVITKLVIICIDRDIPIIIENPYSEQHYLTRYWSLKPKIIDYDRSLRGDYFIKPTQFFFVNFEPKFNLIFESVQIEKNKKVAHISNQTERSLISPYYADRFIREFILPVKSKEDKKDDEKN